MTAVDHGRFIVPRGTFDRVGRHHRSASDAPRPPNTNVPRGTSGPDKPANPLLAAHVHQTDLVHQGCWPAPGIIGWRFADDQPTPLHQQFRCPSSGDVGGCETPSGHHVERVRSNGCDVANVGALHRDVLANGQGRDGATKEIRALCTTFHQNDLQIRSLHGDHQTRKTTAGSKVDQRSCRGGNERDELRGVLNCCLE